MSKYLDEWRVGYKEGREDTHHELEGLSSGNKLSASFQNKLVHRLIMPVSLIASAILFIDLWWNMDFNIFLAIVLSFLFFWILSVFVGGIVVFVLEQIAEKRK